MQKDIAKQIFDKAKEEMPCNFINFYYEECLFYRGFKVSYNIYEKRYLWQEARSPMYSTVSPSISNHVLRDGFKDTINEVAKLHYQKRLLQINRDILDINKQVEYWIDKANTNYITFQKHRRGILGNDDLNKEGKRFKIKLLQEKYDKRQKLFEKKRGVLKEEKLSLMADRDLYITKLKQ